jgi:hypothetical protein
MIQLILVAICSANIADSFKWSSTDKQLVMEVPRSVVKGTHLDDERRNHAHKHHHRQRPPGESDRHPEDLPQHTCVHDQIAQMYKPEINPQPGVVDSTTANGTVKRDVKSFGPFRVVFDFTYLQGGGGVTNCVNVGDVVSTPQGAAQWWVPRIR